MASGANSTQAYEWDGTDFQAVGSPLALAVGNESCGGFSPTQIAFTNTTNPGIRAYNFDGSSWAQQGNSLAIGNSSIAVYGKLTDTLIARIPRSGRDLQAFSFDGTDWTLEGETRIYNFNQFNIGIAALNSTDIATAQSGNGIQTWRWNGSVFTQVGNTLSISASLGLDMTALSATRTVAIDGAGFMRTYDWDGTDWTLLAEQNMGFGSNPARITALSETLAVVAQSVDDELQVYELTGSTWAQVGNGISVPAVSTSDCVTTLN